MDVKGAYLNAPIDKEMYAQQPPGYVQSDENGTPLTCHLRKSLSGLKQSGRNWHSTLTDFLKSQGFTSNKTAHATTQSSAKVTKLSFFSGSMILSYAATHRH